MIMNIPHICLYILYIRFDGLMDTTLDLWFRGREFEYRYGQEFFIL